MKLDHLLLICLLTLITACVQNPSITKISQPGDISSYHPPPNKWQIKGKLGVRTETDSGSVIINWQQREKHYSIHVSGPFGQGNTWIKGNAQQMTIQQTNRQPVTSTNPQQLLEEILGWFLPIDDLRYWIQGIPNSNSAINKPVYNEEGLLATFEQADWSISVSRYRMTEKWLLPSKVKLNKGNVQLTLAIREWHFPQSTAQFSSAP